MRTLLPLLPALLLLAPPSPQATATDCPCRDLELAELVETATTIVLGEVTALHDAAGESVAEVRIVELLKGDLPGDTIFYPVRSASWDPDEGPRVGERAILLLEPSTEFEGTRAFWKTLDRLLGGRPFLDLALSGLGRLPILARDDGVSAVVHLINVSLPPDVLAWLPEGVDAESPERIVDAWTLLDAVRRLLELPADPSGPDRRSPSG
jgi:hypothetical protein